MTMIEFTCNLCGQWNRCAREELDRERPSCSGCGSNVRTRALVQALSLELFGAGIALPDFPRLKSLRGLGTSDSVQYAERLAAKFDYRNTFFDREPRLDLAQPVPAAAEPYDFLVSSEVLEHVPPPASAAFRNLFQLLKPHGLLILSVPYSLELSMAEHFPDLHEFGIAQVAGSPVLVNRRKDGKLQVFENLVFHRDGPQAVLEMREFSESSLRELLEGAGFATVRIHSEDHPGFGILHAETFSLPVAARKGPFAFGVEQAREIVEQYRDLKTGIDGEMKRLGRRFWFRLGRKLGLL